MAASPRRSGTLARLPSPPPLAPIQEHLSTIWEAEGLSLAFVGQMLKKGFSMAETALEIDKLANTVLAATVGLAPTRAQSVNMVNHSSDRFFDPEKLKAAPPPTLDDVED